VLVGVFGETWTTSALETATAWRTETICGSSVRMLMVLLAVLNAEDATDD
jgi:hypothetical protein